MHYAGPEDRNQQTHMNSVLLLAESSSISSWLGVVDCPASSPTSSHSSSLLPFQVSPWSSCCILEDLTRSKYNASVCSEPCRACPRHPSSPRAHLARLSSGRPRALSGSQCARRHGRASRCPSGVSEAAAAALLDCRVRGKVGVVLLW